MFLFGKMPSRENCNDEKKQPYFLHFRDHGHANDESSQGGQFRSNKA